MQADICADFPTVRACDFIDMASDCPWTGADVFRDRLGMVMAMHGSMSVARYFSFLLHSPLLLLALGSASCGSDNADVLSEDEITAPMAVSGVEPSVPAVPGDAAPPGPSAGSGSGKASTATSDAGASSNTSVLDQLRKYNLDRINAYRARDGRASLVLADKLNVFAQAAAKQFVTDGQAHGYFSDHSSTCGCGVFGENQGASFGGDARRQIDEVVDYMYSLGPGEGHHDLMVSSGVQKLGVGLAFVGGRLYLSNDFGK